MFEFISTKKQILRERKRNEALEARQESIGSASYIAFVTLTENGTIDEVTATEHAELFSPWADGITYEVGAIRRYEKVLYRCVQAHTSQEDWTPDKTPALWTKVGDPAEEYPAWSQPIGAHDAYASGDKVSHNNKKWVSAMDGNVWEPGAYGWSEI